jgi:hypothetical protein
MTRSPDAPLDAPIGAPQTRLDPLSRLKVETLAKVAPKAFVVILDFNSDRRRHDNHRCRNGIAI